MRCTRCSSDTDVIESREASKNSPAKRRAARKIAGDAPSFVIRRRKCKSCEQIYHTVEVVMPYPRSVDPS
jgi:transcriptional regulator NrdR family protein